MISANYIHCLALTATLLSSLAGCKRVDVASKDQANTAKLIVLYVLSNQCTDQESVFATVVLLFENSSDGVISIPRSISYEDIVVEPIGNYNRPVSNSANVEIPLGGGIDVGPGVRFFLTAEVRSFDSDFYPPGRYIVFVKQAPACYAVVDKLKSGHFVNHYRPD